MNLHIAINTDNKYLQHAAAMLCSLYENNKNHQIFIHVLSGDLNSENKLFIQNLASRYNGRVVFYDMDNTPLEGVKFRKNRPLSYAAYYRLLLSSTIDKSIDKILYLDCDMIVLGDLSELFGFEIDGYAVAATLDNTPCNDLHRRQLHFQVGEKAFCSGVMVVNLKYWRDNNVEPLLIEYAKRDREQVFYHDQDAFNYVFKGKWFMLPPKWNRYAYSNRLPSDVLIRPYDYFEYCRNPQIIHYANLDIKPWMNCMSCNKGFYIKYLKLSGYNNPIFTKVSIFFKIKAIVRLLLYNYEIYVKPYLPKLVILLIDDLKYIVKFIVAICTCKISDFSRLRDNF